MSNLNKEVKAGRFLYQPPSGPEKWIYVFHSQDGSTRVHADGGIAGSSDDTDIFIDGEFVVDDSQFANHTGGKQNIKDKIEDLILKSIDGNGGLNKNWATPGWMEEANAIRLSTLADMGTSKDLKDYGGFDRFLGATGDPGTSPKSAQYPIDALYYANGADNIAAGGRTGKPEEEGQDHLVISQYKYKVPRAKDFFNKSNNLLIEGIERNSALDKFLGLVRLPMPNDITDSNNVKWGEDVMNAIEAAGIAQWHNASGMEQGLAAAAQIGGDVLGAEGLGGAVVLGKILGGEGGSLGQIRDTYGAEITSRILAMAGIEASAASILARGRGVIPNSNLELLFQAPMLREFQFNYRMSQRSDSEARVINHIVRFFKQGMAAKKVNASSGTGSSYFLGTPNVFRLQYRTANNEAPEGVNRMKTCALTGTSVNYTPEGAWAAYEGGQPVSIMLSMRFQELEPIYDTDYAQYSGDMLRVTDDEKAGSTGAANKCGIRSTEVGY